MDQEKIGKFIYELRTKNKLTQRAFADRLSVTAQAVSKWENGRGIPDIEIMKEISKEFNTSVESILAGEDIPKKNRKKLILLSIIIISLLGLILILVNNNTFEFSNLKSNDKEWKIKGVAAYSKDKNSIYISDIEYLNNKKNIEKYTVVECVLYESNNDVDKKISQCGKIDTTKNYDINNAKELSELLKNIEFNVDDYKSSCRNLKNSKLYIDINVLTTDNIVKTYKVPIKLNSDCSK